MDNINGRIIFGVLARHGAVSLPGTGVLWVERVAARREGSRLIPPRNAVRFSPKERDDAQSVVTLLEGHAGSAESAGQIYREWFEGARTAKGVRIEGVGELTGHTFTPSPELEKALNPHIPASGQKIKIKRRGGGRAAGIVFSILAIVLIAGSAWWYFGHESLGWPLLPWEAGRQSSVAVAAPENPTPPIPDRIVPADSLAVEADSLPVETVADTLATGMAAPSATQEPTATATPMTTALYHVVGGVFSVDANADKYIAGMKRKFPSLDISYQKVPFKGGKVMVSLYSSADRKEADRHLSEMSRATSNPDLWIYKSN